MLTLVGTKRDNLLAIAYNLVRNDDNFIIVYCCQCNKYDEITIQDFENGICKCNKKKHIAKIIRENKEGRKANLIGKKFGHLNILEELEPCGKNRKFKCLCDCGAICEKWYASLSTGRGDLACTRGCSSRKPGTAQVPSEPTGEPVA